MTTLLRSGAALIAAVALTNVDAAAQINLAPGDVAIIGWADNLSPNDAFTIVALADLPAGTVLYFTDNGWDSVGNFFRNTSGPTDGDGNENLVVLTANALIPAGTIVSTIDTGASFTWTSSGAVVGTGVTNGTYQFPALSQTGDQLYAFQHDTGDNALNTATQAHVFVLDDTGVFESTTNSNTGDVPPGLAVALGTAVTFAQNSTGQNFMAFNTGTLSNGTRAQWLAAIADPLNWTFAASGTLPSGSIVVGGGVGPGSGFCFGDGSGTACPCANPSPLGNGEGCLSSLGTGGRLVGSGAASLAADTLVLGGTQMPNSSALYFQGTTQLGSGAGSAFGDGLRCAGGSVIRLATKTNSGGGSQYPALGDPSVSVKGLVGAPGVRTYQCWYRNAATFCTASTFNLTNGWQTTWAP